MCQCEEVSSGSSYPAILAIPHFIKFKIELPHSMTYDLPKIIVKSFCISHKCLLTNSTVEQGFPAGSAVNNQPTNAGDTGSIPGSESSPAGRNGNPLQYFCLENPIDRGAWQATARGVTELSTIEYAHMHTQ